jgi:hypothetical protein
MERSVRSRTVWAGNGSRRIGNVGWRVVPRIPALIRTSKRSGAGGPFGPIAGRDGARSWGMSESGAPLQVIDEGDLTNDDLVTWSDSSDSCDRVSLYLPTHRAGREVNQDPVRFRRLVARAGEEVADGDLLATARALVDDRTFWAHGCDGLAVLAAPEGTTAIRLSQPTSELAVVSDRHHVKPLVAAIGRRLRLDVLALSRHAVRLVEVTGSSAAEIEVPGLPTSMAQALRWDDREPQLQSHSVGRAGSGRVAAAFHGQGDKGDVDAADLDRYLRQVDRSIADHRSGSKRPLVLAGVDELVAAYRKLTACEHVLGTHVAGNPDQSTVTELADRARRFARPPTAEAEQTARESFLRGTAATVDSVEQAVIAAAAGQVASVLVPADREYWGRYHPGRRLLDMHDEREPGDHDLADVTATETLRHGGLAFVVPAPDIPGGGSAAATLRF